MTTVTTPKTIYTLSLNKNEESVTLVISGDTLATATNFTLHASESEMIDYFMNYLSIQIAGRFTPKMANADFITRLQDLVSTVLANWTCDNYKMNH